MDGFFNKRTVAPAASVKTLAAKAKEGVSPIINSSAEAATTLRQTTAKTVHRGAQRSKTLVRSAVSKPAAVKPKANSLFVNQTNRVQASKVNDSRAFRAKSASKNAKVRRFSGFSSSKAKQPTVTTAVEGSIPAAAAAASASSREVMPSMVTSVSHQHLERLLDQALHRADAHKKAMQGKLPGRSWWRRTLDAPRWASLGTAFLIIAILGAFFAWQNVPQVSMRLAATKSSVNASVPDYTPPGFSFAGPIQYTNSSVTMDFKANSDDARNFKITQEKSTETSPSLAANSLADDSTVQTSQVNGTTVYIYGDQNHATWVNHGVRYTIQDNAKLDTEQILKIAGSLQ